MIFMTIKAVNRGTSYSKQHTYETGVIIDTRTKTNFIVTAMALLFYYFHSPKLLVSILTKILMGIAFAPVLALFEKYIFSEWETAFVVMVLFVARAITIAMCRHSKLYREGETLEACRNDFIALSMCIILMGILEKAYLAPDNITMPYIRLAIGGIVCISMAIPTAENLSLWTDGRFPPLVVMTSLRLFKRTGKIKDLKNIIDDNESDKKE